MLRTADQVRERAARIDRADNQVGVVELRGCVIPISIVDVDNCLDILGVAIDDSIFAISGSATTA